MRTGWFLALGLLASSFGCQNELSRSGVTRERIQAALAAYAEGLTVAYATGMTEPLAKVASPREVERVEARVAQLAEEGKFLEPRLQRQQLEDLSFSRATTAFASVQETWSFEVRALGSRAVLAVEEAQVQQVRYTLLREPDGTWMVISRAVLGTPQAS